MSKIFLDSKRKFMYMCIHIIKSSLMVCCSLICVFSFFKLSNLYTDICFFSLFYLFWSPTCMRFVFPVWRELSVSTSLSSRATCIHQAWSWPVGVTQGGTRKGYLSVVYKCFIDFMSLYDYFICKKIQITEKFTNITGLVF